MIITSIDVNKPISNEQSSRDGKKINAINAAQEFYKEASESQKKAEDSRKAIMAETKAQQESRRRFQENQHYEQTGKLLG